LLPLLAQHRAVLRLHGRAAEVERDALIGEGDGGQVRELAAHGRLGRGAELLVNDAALVGIKEQAFCSVALFQVEHAGLSIGGRVIEPLACELWILAPVVPLEGDGLVGFDHGSPRLIAALRATSAGELSRLVENNWQLHYAHPFPCASAVGGGGLSYQSLREKKSA